MNRFEALFEHAVEVRRRHAVDEARQIRARRSEDAVGGKEYIRIAGVVRPEDLSGNVVCRRQMAEAHIEFSGDGETYLAPKMGILQRLFLTVSTVWPGDWF